MWSVGKPFTTPSGERVRLYYIGTFAKMLDRTVMCIHIWEKEHIIPETPFKDKHGRRMYTMEQMESVKKFLEKYDIKKGRKIVNTNFSLNVFRYWDELKKQYLKKG